MEVKLGEWGSGHRKLQGGVTYEPQRHKNCNIMELCPKIKSNIKRLL